MVIISGGVDLAPGAVMALAGVVTGDLFVIQGHPLPAAVTAGILAGLLCGILSATLVVLVKLPPFIATLGVMGIARGIAFIITEGRFFDLSSRLPAGWKPFGLPADWLAPIVLVVLAVVFQYLMQRFQWGRAIFAIGGNEHEHAPSGGAVPRRGGGGGPGVGGVWEEGGGRGPRREPAREEIPLRGDAQGPQPARLHLRAHRRRAGGEGAGQRRGPLAR